MDSFHLSLKHHTLSEIFELSQSNQKIILSSDLIKRIVDCRNYLDKRMENQKEPIYGITTGFGSLCNVTVDRDQLSQLQKNLVMSHACGVGEEVPSEIVRLMLLLKIKSLSYGYSGVRLETVKRLVEMYNEGVIPIVYQQGSLGASGDLAPLANMSLPLIGMGEVWYKGERRDSASVNALFGWEPLELASKEGLALLNGTQFMLAYSIWNFMKAKRMSDMADIIAAFSLEAFDGRIEPFTEGVHTIRPHKGQVETAANMRKALEGSEIASRYKAHVQDPYSFRCVPQVHGATKDALVYIESAFETELNSATDNSNHTP